METTMNNKPIGFYDFIKPTCDSLDIFRGTIHVPVPYGGMFTFPGLAQRRKLLGFIPWFSETLAKAWDEPRFNSHTNTWEGPFKIQVYDEKKIEALIQALEKIGIECEVSIRARI